MTLRATTSEGPQGAANGGERGKISTNGQVRTICKSFSVIVQSGRAKKIKKLANAVVCELRAGFFAARCKKAAETLFRRL